MTETQSKSIMAFDFGTQKMGMAIGQSSIESANPLPLFVMKDGIPNWDQLLFFSSYNYFDIINLYTFV
jgi:putative Holliday junction resolvase